MNQTHAFTLMLSALFLFTPGCVNPQNNRNESAATPTPESKSEAKPKEEKQFSFPAQGGKEITAHVYPDLENADRKMIIFTPFLDRTDGNLYNASLHSLWNVYGKQRGLFLLKDGKTKFDKVLGGNAICWAVSNPKQQFCVLPIKDSESGGIGVLHVWAE